MGITGILSAIAIPQYNKYRKNAAESAFQAVGSNIARAFGACIATGSFTGCDTLSELNFSCGNICKTPVAMAPYFCVPMEQEIAGSTYKGCVSSNATTGAAGTTLNQQVCYDESGSTAMIGGHTCSATAYDMVSGCGDNVNPGYVPCTAPADCTAIGSNYCPTAQTGTCKTSGECQ